jgi:hypothetical protein
LANLRPLLTTAVYHHPPVRLHIISIADKLTTAAETTPSVEKEIPTGPAAAAILAAGIGSTALGIFVILNDAFAG